MCEEVTEIAGCPFCGDSECRVGGDEGHEYVYCTNCGAEGPLGDFNEAQAIAAWNQRNHPRSR